MPGRDLSVRVVSADGSAVRVAVQVREGGTETQHDVTAPRQVLDRLAPGEAPESFVRRCFEFLLEREPKESILRRFDVTVIGQYFPDFERVISRPPKT